MNLKKYEHVIVIGIVSAIIGTGVGGYLTPHPAIPEKPIVKKVEPQGLTPESARKLALSKLDDYGWTKTQWSCLNRMWGKESAWNYKAASPTKDHGIPQRHMSGNTKAQIHAFQSDPVAQINWGLNYIKTRYQNPCGAWKFWQANRWY